VASRIQQQTRNSVTIEDWLDEYKDIDEAKDKHQDSLEDKQAD
jgi:hypothetical protein